MRLGVAREHDDAGRPAIDAMDQPQTLAALGLERAPERRVGSGGRCDDEPRFLVDGEVAVGFGEDADQVWSTQRSAGSPSMLAAFFSIWYCSSLSSPFFSAH